MRPPFRRWFALVAAFLAVLAGVSEGAEITQVRELVVIGVVGPRNVVLTPRRPSATKPVAVVVQNRGAGPLVISDAASLRKLIELNVEPLIDIPAPLLILVPPRKPFPITVKPLQRLAVLFRVKFELGDSPAGAIQVRYDAAIPRTPTGLSVATEAEGASRSAIQIPPIASASAGVASRAILPASTSSLASFGPDNGATVTAKPMRVALKKGQPKSEPITFMAKWPGKPFQVSGWSNAPADPVADPIFDNAHGASVTGRWKNAGTYVVTAFLNHFPPGGAFEHARPSEQIHVISVEFKDENGNDADGMKIGVTTGSKDRSRSLRRSSRPHRRPAT